MDTYWLNGQKRLSISTFVLCKTPEEQAEAPEKQKSIVLKVLTLYVKGMAV